MHMLIEDIEDPVGSVSQSLQLLTGCSDRDIIPAPHGAWGGNNSNSFFFPMRITSQTAISQGLESAGWSKCKGTSWLTTETKNWVIYSQSSIGKTGHKKPNSSKEKKERGKLMAEEGRVSMWLWAGGMDAKRVPKLNLSSLALTRLPSVWSSFFSKPAVSACIDVLSMCLTGHPTLQPQSNLAGLL